MKTAYVVCVKSGKNVWRDVFYNAKMAKTYKRMKKCVCGKDLDGIPYSRKRNIFGWRKPERVWIEKVRI